MIEKLSPEEQQVMKQQYLADRRERIALKAMVAILGNPSTVLLGTDSPLELATECYAIADAMIKQKCKPIETPPVSNE